MDHWWDDADGWNRSSRRENLCQAYIFRHTYPSWTAEGSTVFFRGSTMCYTYLICTALTIRAVTRYLLLLLYQYGVECNVYVTAFCLLQVSWPTRKNIPIPGGELKLIILLFIFQREWTSSSLYRAFRRDTQSAHQPMHIRKIVYIKTFKIAPTCFDPKTIFREL